MTLSITSDVTTIKLCQKLIGSQLSRVIIGEKGNKSVK